MAACRAAHEAEALEEVQACEMAGGRPHTIREEAGSGAMVAARSRLSSAVSVSVRGTSSRAMLDCGVGAAQLAVGVGVTIELGGDVELTVTDIEADGIVIWVGDSELMMTGDELLVAETDAVVIADEVVDALEVADQVAAKV